MRTIIIEISDLEAHSLSMAAIETERTDVQWASDAVRNSILLYERLQGQPYPRALDDAFVSLL